MHPRYTDNRAEDPFKMFSISDWTIFDRIENRSNCPKCQKSRKYFCYQCYIPVPSLTGILPKIKLPIKIDIIKHSKEIDGKSTAVHAALLAPDDVRIFTYPDFPDYSQENIAVLYPRSDSKTIAETFQEFKSIPYSRIIVIDSTWNQSKGIFKDQQFKNRPTLVLTNRISQFWRHQKKSPRWYLATIEAVHQLAIEIDLTQSNNYDSRYDDLLLIFRFMYSKIHSLYRHSDLLSYKRPLN